MRFELVLAPEAARTLALLPAYDRSALRDALETHLRHEPGKVSRSRIKRLRGLRQPQYRLRVNDYRVIYDIDEQEVQILAVVSKEQAETWLADFGRPEA